MLCNKNNVLQHFVAKAFKFHIPLSLSLSWKIIRSLNDQLYILSLLENQAVCKRASASHQRNITATPHATHNIQIDYGKSVPWVHLE